EAAVGDRVVDPRQVLLDDRPRPEVEVADLGVAHLAVRKADVPPAGRERRVRIALPELVEGRGVREADRIAGPRRGESPPVENDQGEGRRGELGRARGEAHGHAAAISANWSGSRLAPPTNAPSIASGLSSSAAFAGFTDPP